MGFHVSEPVKSGPCPTLLTAKERGEEFGMSSPTARKEGFEAQWQFQREWANMNLLPQVLTCLYWGHVNLAVSSMLNSHCKYIGRRKRRYFSWCLFTVGGSRGWSVALRRSPRPSASEVSASEVWTCRAVCVAVTLGNWAHECITQGWRGFRAFVCVFTNYRFLLPFFFFKVF